MYVFLAILLIIVSLLLLMVIMIQNPKGGGLLQNFGSQGAQMFGVQRTSDFLEKSTWVLSFILFVLILVFNCILKD